MKKKSGSSLKFIYFFINSEAEFKEFEPCFNFEPRLKFDGST